MRRAIKKWQETISILKRHPIILLPFMIASLFDALALYILYLVPQKPLSIVLAPPVRVFFGEKFLHYPFNLYLLSTLFYYARIVLSATVGIIMTAMAVGMIKDVLSGERPKILLNLVISLKRYFALLGIWALTFILSFSFIKLTNIIHLKEHLGGSAPYLLYTGLIFLQLMFIYAIPALIIERKSMFSSLKINFVFLKNYFLSTCFLVMIPAFLYYPVLVLKQKLPQLTAAFFPEIVLAVLGAGVFISFFIDMLVTASPVINFLQAKQ